MASFLEILGGAGLITIVVSIVSKFVLDGLLNSQKKNIAKDIEKYKLEIKEEFSKQRKLSDIRFGMYNKLWAKLVELKISGDELWDSVTNNTLINFTSKLKETEKIVEVNRLLLIEKDYISLQEVFHQFNSYQIGKQKLSDYKIDDVSVANIFHIRQEQINQIKSNKQVKKKYEELLNQLHKKFKKQINLS